MAVNDIQIARQRSLRLGGFYQVHRHAGAYRDQQPATGRPLPWSSTVTAMATNKPVVATDFVVGIAMSNSTQTASCGWYG